MPVGDILPELAVLLTAVGIVLLASFLPHARQWVCAPVAIAGLVVAMALCAAQAGRETLTFSGVWALDGASVWGRLMVLGTAAAVCAFSPDWMRSDRRHGEYYAILLFSCLGAMAMAAAADLLQLVMSALLSSVTGYTLAAYHRDWAVSVEAGMKYFLMGALANTALAIGVVLVFGMLGTTDYHGLEATLASTENSALLSAGVGLVAIGLAFKLGAVPAHAWVPDVAEGAPAPAAAFLTVAPKIGGAIALARFVSLFPPDALALRPVVAALAVTTMTLGNLAALWQDDLRRLLGWSSVSQSGYALMAVAVIGLAPDALPALLYFLLGYAVANLAAFGAVIHLRGRTAARDYAGLVRDRPWTAFILVAALLSLVGIPPLAGFIGKMLLFLATIDGGYAWLAAAAIANTVVSLFYYARVIAPVCFGASAGQPAILGTWSGTTMLAAGALLLVFGIGSGPLLDSLGGPLLQP